MRKYYMKKFLVLFIFSLVFFTDVFSQTIPTSPTHYVNDYANLLSPNIVKDLNQKLKHYEQETSHQIVVAIFSGNLNSSIEDFSSKLEEQWKIGQKDKDNGVLLVIFPKDHQLRIEVGYGLEGVIPDALANTIIQQEIIPAFKAGNYDQGVTQGVLAIMQAAKNKSFDKKNSFPYSLLVILVFITVVVFISYLRNRNVNGGINYPDGRWNNTFDRNNEFNGGGGSSGGGGASGTW